MAMVMMHAPSDAHGHDADMESSSDDHEASAHKHDDADADGEVDTADGDSVMQQELGQMKQELQSMEANTDDQTMREICKKSPRPQKIRFLMQLHARQRHVSDRKWRCTTTCSRSTSGSACRITDSSRRTRWWPTSQVHSKSECKCLYPTVLKQNSIAIVLWLQIYPISGALK